MPNYVKNIVTVSEETMNKIKEKYFKRGILSFDKIIPMPKRFVYAKLKKNQIIIEK